MCDQLWGAINKATDYSLRKNLETGMISKAMYDKLSGMFEYYIPLRGWDETTAADVYDCTMGDRGGLS